MILWGDVREVLPTVDAGSVQCVVTSPPYWGLRDYGTATWDGGDPACEHQGQTARTVLGGEGKQYTNKGSNRVYSGACHCGAKRIDAQIGLEPTPEAFIATMVAVFREVRRVLRDDGTVWLNLGDCYAATGKSGGGSQGEKWADHGSDYTGPKGGKWRPAPDGLKPKDLCMMPARVALALQADGWYLRSDIIWAKGLSFCPDYAGSVMPESVTDRPTQSHEHVFLLTKQARYYYDVEAVRERGTEPAGTYAGVKGPATHARSLASGAPAHGNEVEGVGWTYSGTRNLRNVWTINPQPFSEAHFATFPTALVEPCVKAGSKKGDMVLDPFCGAGTTGLVAGRLGREFIGIELNRAYIALAQDRIEGPLFARG